MTPYGFIKATVMRDSSDPDGDDFPYPGIFLQSSNALSTGPTNDPSFHIKARSSRFGSNFEWPDISPKLTLTGKVEGDSRADTRKSTMPMFPRFAIRSLACACVCTARLCSDRQDGRVLRRRARLVVFGSSAVANLLETTFFGAYSGNIWERSPQFRFGMVQKLGNSDRNFKFSPEFAIMMPSTGEIMKLNSVNFWEASRRKSAKLNGRAPIPDVLKSKAGPYCSSNSTRPLE